MIKKAFLLITAALIAAGNVLKAENYPYNDNYMWVTVPDHPDWLYSVGENPVVSVQLFNLGIPVSEQKIKCSVSDDRLEEDSFSEITLKGGKAQFKVGGRRKPGFRNVRFSFNDPLTGMEVSHSIKLGFDVDDIRPLTKEPDDFSSFWETAVSYARETSLEPAVLEEVSEASDDEVITTIVRLNTSKGFKVYGYLTRPREEGKYPVVLVSPGAGIHPIKYGTEFARKGMIALSIEIHGIDLRVSNDFYKALPSMLAEYWKIGLENKDNYYYKHVYTALVRSIDYLTSLDAWDEKNVIAFGGSQGGALSIVIAGLDARITHCVSNYPALADMGAYSEKGSTGGWPHFKKADPESLITLSYYDIVNFAPMVKAKTFMLWGYNDNVCPPTTSYAVWNSLGCENKVSKVCPAIDHRTNNMNNAVELDWIVNNLY